MINQIEKDLSTCPKVIIILGGPGSGKGTQGKLIEKEFGYIHLSIGDILRQTGNYKVENYNKELSSIKNTCLTHELSLNLLKESMIERGWSGGKFLLDGFHRKFDIYDEKLMNEIDILAVIVLKPKDDNIDVLRSRILKRFEDHKDKQGSRVHDLEIMEKRLSIYQTDTQEVIKYFISSLEEKVSFINCENEVEVIYKEIRQYLMRVID